MGGVGVGFERNSYVQLTGTGFVFAMMVKPIMVRLG